MRVKICGIASVEQGRAIARAGATTLGFICVKASPRYVEPRSIREIIDGVPAHIEGVGVFANAEVEQIVHCTQTARLSGIQLHGQESPEFCTQLQQQLPGGVEVLKAIRVSRTEASLQQAAAYLGVVDTLLLDAYEPDRLGGTGKTLDWEQLKKQLPLPLPWFLAGGLTPDNIATALSQVQPHGIDLSSGVERSPGDKDLAKVERLFATLKTLGYAPPS